MYEPKQISRLSRRAALTGLVGASAWATLGCRPASAGSDVAMLPDFRAPGDVDDSEAFRRALEISPRIHFPAGGGSADDGAYLMSATETETLPSGLTLSGDGPGASVIRRSYRRQGPFILHCDSKSPDPAGNIANLGFRDLTFQDDVETHGFSGHDYLVMLNGVSDVTVDNVHFVGFRGDGLHLGSSTVWDVERHNRRVRVTDCVFDGINANNRNGISVIDCEDLLIERCRFLNCSRRGGPKPSDPFDPFTGVQAPGAIDLEPDMNAFAIIRNVAIRMNTFDGGGGYGVCVYLLADSFVTNHQKNIRIEQNQFRNLWGGLGVSGGMPAAETSTRSADIVIAGNSVVDCEKPFIIDGVRGITLEDNVIADCASMGELGYVHGNRDVVLNRNVFRRLGREQGGYGLWIRAVDTLALQDNEFIDIGFDEKRFGIGIAFVSGIMKDVTLEGNTFASPTGKMTEALTVFFDARPDRSTVSAANNRLTFTAPAISQALGI